ncbi:UNVERIFIED_CONTAM: hypothetical protein K2H54_055577 [Gekko kuhli]
MSEADIDNVLSDVKLMLEKTYEEKCVESYSKAFAKVFSAQVMGKIVGIALKKWYRDICSLKLYFVLEILVFQIYLGEKFKITNNMKLLLNDLQEIETEKESRNLPAGRGQARHREPPAAEANKASSSTISAKQQPPCRKEAMESSH